MTPPLPWQRFVLDHGRHVRGHLLAAIVGQPESDIEAFRDRTSCRRGALTGFAELFALFNGRPPVEADWPTPRKGGGGGYEWLGNELALLASLVGRMSSTEISAVLTTRLQQITGDPAAIRNRQSVQLAINRTGLMATDVVGGLTVKEAGKEAGGVWLIYQAISGGHLQVRKVGRLLVIPHAEFARWKAARQFVPPGYVRLASLKYALGFKSDKLSEFARAGRVPQAIQCTGMGTQGCWYIPKKYAAQLIADRRAGRPMPWWGTADSSNLKVTFTLWQKRQHPARCEDCRHIWGPAGPPTSFEDYVVRYVPLTHGAKRHLTRIWSDGLTIAQVAVTAHVTKERVIAAIDAGVLRATRVGRSRYITQTDATRWVHRKCPTGGSEKSWLALPTARALYGFSIAELEQHIAAKRLTLRIGDFGGQIGMRLVSGQQCRELRDTLGYPLAIAAQRLKITVEELTPLLATTGWRPSDQIHAETIATIKKRLRSAPGISIAAAAAHVQRTPEWVEAQIHNGTVRVLTGKWDADRRYISKPMLRRLEQAAAGLRQPPRQWAEEWVLLSDGAQLAGVSPATLLRWAAAGEVTVHTGEVRHRYHRTTIEMRARRYWNGEVRFHRKAVPAWLAQEAHA